MYPTKKDSEEEIEDLTREEQIQSSIKDGYRALAGSILAVIVAEAILYLGGVTKGDYRIPIGFALIGLLMSIRHILQIRQAKEELKELNESQK
jgi:hypothetical protein